MPTIVVVGRGLADGVVEVKDRGPGERRDVALDAVVGRAGQLETRHASQPRCRRHASAIPSTPRGPARTPCSTPSASAPASTSCRSPRRTRSTSQQVAFPTQAVVLGWGAGSPMKSAGTFNPAMLVHGQQSVTLHQPLPPEGSATLTARITAMYDKGKAGGGRHVPPSGQRRPAAVHHDVVGVHPRRGRLGRRPRPQRARRTSRRSAPPTSRSPTRPRPTRR